MADTAPALRRALAATLLALGALTAALFLWLRPPAETPRATGHAAVPSESDALREPVEPEVGAQAPPPATDPATTPANALAAADEPEPEPEPRRAVGERAPARTGSLRVDADLDPRLGSARLFVGSGGCLPLDAPAAPAAQVLAGGFVRDCGVGSGDGWHVHGLRPGPLRLLVTQPGGARKELDGLWLLAGEDLRVTVPRAATFALELRVLGPDGAPLLGAPVWLAGDRPGGAVGALGPGASSPAALTGADGLAILAPPLGAWRLLVGAPARHAVSLAPRALEGESRLGDEPRRIEIDLAAGGEIAGDVLDPDDLGFAGRRVAAWSASGPGPAPAEALALGLSVDALATVAGAEVTPEGRFALRHLPGDALLALRVLVDSDLAHDDGFATLVRARAGERGVVLTQRAGAALELEVLERDTLAPIERFSLELPGTWPGTARTGRDGRLAWSGLRPYVAAGDAKFADLPESPDLEPRVLADGFDLALAPPLRLRTGETTRAPRLLLNPLPALHLRVVDARDGAPIEGAECALEAVLPEMAVGRTSSRDTSAADGRARLTLLASNLADLVVRCPGWAPLRLRAPRATLPDAPLEVALAPGAVLRVRVLDVERRPVRALVLRRRTVAETGDALAQSDERALTDAEGWAEFRDLDAGIFAVAACQLARSDVDALPSGRLSWTSIGVGAGAAAELEIGAAAARPVELELTWLGQALPGAVLRLSHDLSAFSAPHDDQRTFLTGPALRADEHGRAALSILHEGLYALRVEHPLVPGFARALPNLGASDGLQTLELAAELLGGEVVRDGERVTSGRAVLWAHGTFHEGGMQVEAGALLRELAPEPIFLGECALANGYFALPVPHGVELIVTADDGEASGDYYVRVPDGPREPIAVAIEPSLTLEVRPGLRGKRTRAGQLGLVGYHVGQPWGRGLIAMPLDAEDLSIADLPPGLWRLCLVELAGGQLVLERGDWSEYVLEGGRHGVRVDWRRSERR